MATAVLIVNYRSYESLGTCLASLDSYLGPGDEVCVVDYESNSAALAVAIRGCSRATTLPRADNRGFAAGVNLGAAATSAPFLMLLNPDTIVEAPVVRSLESWMIEHRDVGVAGPRILNADGTVQRSARCFPDITTIAGGRSTWLSARFPDNWISRRNLVQSNVPIDVDWVSGACLATRRDAFNAIGGFDEGFFLYWEDADYCRRITAAGHRCMYVPTLSVKHVGGVSAARDQGRAIRAFHDSAYRLYWKHSSPLGRLVAPLVKAGLRTRAWMRQRRAPDHSGRGAA